LNNENLTFFLLPSPPLPKKNPRFIQDTAYEPLSLNIPLLGGSTNRTSSNPEEPAMDTVVTVEDEQPLEGQDLTAEEQQLSKKRRTIRFAEE
jgi:hypothetical protein